MRSQLAVVGAILLVASCGERSAPGIADSDALRATIQSLAGELAQAISQRDPAAAARHVREDDHVVYISDGTVIRGREYRQVLERFYAGLQQLDFKWDRWEVRAIGANAGVFTGWATIASVDKAGRAVEDRALFSLVYGQTLDGWELIAAHKTTIR